MSYTSADDYSDNLSTTGNLIVGRQVFGAIELPNDKDWFKVTLQAGTTYVFDLLGSAGNGGTLGLESNGAYLKLYNRSGYYVDGTANNGVGGDPRLSYTPTTSGNYYLSVSDLFDKTGSYMLKATESSPDDYSDNMQTTGAVSVGGQVSGEIELPNDKDWFKVTLQAGTTYVFDLLGAAGNGGTLGLESNGAYLKLYNRSGYYVDGTANNGVGGDPRLSYTPTTSGNYYLSVSDLFDKTGIYVLKASLAPSVYPSNSRDIIVGSTGNDLIKGLGGSDKLSGGSGNDTLIGGIGNDTLLGGAGRDIIIGGAGRDSLVGGAGNDVFDFNALIDLGKNQKSRDVISDFSIGKDKIDLSSIGLDLKLPEKQSFVFVENFNAAGQVKFSNGVVYLNVDGDLAAEYQIRVLGASTLSASDFIL